MKLSMRVSSAKYRYAPRLLLVFVLGLQGHNVQFAWSAVEETAAPVAVQSFKPVIAQERPGIKVYVPAGHTLVLGSLDQAAGRHVLEISLTGSGPSEVRDHQSRDHHQYTVVQASGAGQFPSVHFVPRPQQPVEETDARVMPAVRRRFEIPYFENGRVYSQCLLAEPVLAAHRTLVYARDVDSDVLQIAKKLGALVDEGLLHFVEQQVAAIHDVDGDGRLTFVIGDLGPADSHSGTGTQPVYGCVRSSDFLEPTGPFDGDIVYLDRRLPVAELAGILGHELTHAAIFSAVLRTKRSCEPSIPCWLNEALAHYVERQVDGDSPNLRDRERAFGEQPHLFPVVIPDGCSELALRRGPSRAAAVRFLEATFARHEIRRPGALLADDVFGVAGLESATDCSLEQLLWEWGVESVLNRPGPVVSVPLAGALEIELRGTAFIGVAPSAEPHTVLVRCGEACNLKVAVVESSRTRLVRR